MDSLEPLIREIAEKHGIVVGRDDPILILQTINFRLLQDSAKAQQAQLDQYKEELEGLALRWGNDAKEKAERILNAALTASRETMERVLEEASKKAAEAVAVEVNKSLSSSAARVQDVRKLVWLNVFASCAAIAAAAIVLLAGA